MKKRKTIEKLANELEEKTRLNPVAKFANQFNKAKIFDDKDKYCRKVKYVKQEDSDSDRE